MKKIILIGAGGHCKVIIDLIKSIGEYEIVGVTDKDKFRDKILDINIIGDDSNLIELYNSGVNYAFICVGEIGSLRRKIYNKLKEIGFQIPILVNKNAIISSYAKIAEGTCIMPGAIINSDACIGRNCIINTGAIIEHECYIEDNCHISPNVSLAGGVKVGCNTHIGIGCSVIQSVSIGNNVTIGAGAVVINDIEDNSLAVGVPAKVIKTKDVI